MYHHRSPRNCSLVAFQNTSSTFVHFSVVSSGSLGRLCAIGASSHSPFGEPPLVLLRDDVDRTQIQPIALEHPAHRKNPLTRGIIQQEISCQPQRTENALILNQPQRPKQVHRRITDRDHTEADILQQELPFAGRKRASADMNDG